MWLDGRRRVDVGGADISRGGLWTEQSTGTAEASEGTAWWDESRRIRMDWPVGLAAEKVPAERAQRVPN